MKTIILLMTIFFTNFGAEAAVHRMFQDQHFPTQVLLEKQSLDNLQGASTVYISANNPGPINGNTTVVSSFSAQPDVPRNIVITPGATTGDVENCVITVAGTDILNNAITEDFTFLANASTAQTGARAFKTITSATFPASCESGGYAATWSFGIGEKIGIKRCMDNPGDVFKSLLNGATEATGPTVVSNASEVSKNTADFVGTMNGTNDFILYFLQNFQCL